MAATRFFQHLNENNSDFQKVTTLDFIDNSDGFVMYYFKDGSKCNKNFIAPINADDIKGFEFAEVSNQYNIWKLKKVIPELSQERPKAAIGEDGILYEAPTLEEYTQTQKHAKTRVDVLSKPIEIKNYQEPDDSDYYFNPDTYRQEAEEPVFQEVKETFDFNNNETKKVSQKTIEQIVPNKKQQSQEYCIDIQNILNNKKVVLKFPDGKIVELDPAEFIENAITPKEEKVVEKVVEKEVIVKTTDTDIELDINSEQKTLINNMIDMSNKVDYDIDLELTLSLPPASVYKLIKTVYPAGMAENFVNILANRMQIKELKSAVSCGLLAFYEEDLTAEKMDSETETEVKSVKHNNRKKEAANN